jgi:nitrite reductase/ring-hydroxylating ferredoxin subunit
LKVAAGSLAELPDRKPVRTRAGGREIVLVRWGEDVYALRNVCPHMTKTFELGMVYGWRDGEVGEVRHRDDIPVLTCPWHQYEYSLKDGQCLTAKRWRVKTYPVELDGDTIIVDLGRQPRRAAGEGEAALPSGAAAASGR